MSSSVRPLVSVIVPVHNGERFLAEALDSVLAQEYDPIEVVVVDDGSTDSSARVAASRPARVIRRPHDGVSAARNAGAAASRGELLAFLDADDVWLPDALAVQVQHLLDHPELGFVVGQMRIVVSEDTPHPPWYRPEWDIETVPSALPVVWRSMFERVGGYDPRYATAEDLDWMARAHDAGVEHAVVADVVRVYRLHGHNTTYEQEAARSDSFRVLRATLARRRRDAGTGGSDD